MRNIIDSDVSACGIPVHNPPYWGKQAFCSFDAINLMAKISRPDVIAALVPHPLIPLGDTIQVTASKIREFKANIAPHMKSLAWSEIEIQVPVSFKNRYYLYWCEAFTNNYGMMTPDRELFGFPKVLADIQIEREGNNWQAHASYCGQDRGIFAISFQELRPGTSADIGMKPCVMNLKHIPSPESNAPAQVKQLVTLNYVKQMLRKTIVGKGQLELLEDAPKYLVDAEIKGIEKAMYLQIDITMDGGRIVYDYKQHEENTFTTEALGENLNTY